jgi:hypothetical protein
MKIKRRYRDFFNAVSIIKGNSAINSTPSYPVCLVEATRVVLCAGEKSSKFPMDIFYA